MCKEHMSKSIGQFKMIQNATSGRFYESMYSTQETLALTICLSIIILASLIGSVIMLFVLFKNDKMWTSSNMLIGNLAVASLGATVLVMPFSLYTTAKHRWIFKEGAVCKLTGSCGSLFLLGTIFTHTMISIDKYFAVVKPMSRVMTFNKTCGMISGIWLVALIMSAAPFLGISGFEYNPTTLICGVKYPQENRDRLYLLTLALLGFILPNLIMGYVYTRVHLAIRQHTVRLLAHAVISFDVLKLQKRLVLTVFASLLCFLLCWSPFFALTIAGLVTSDRRDIPHGLGVAAYWTGYLNSALNPVIICSMSNRFKQGFIEILNSSIMLICGCQRDKSMRKFPSMSTLTTDIPSMSTLFRKRGKSYNLTSNRSTTLPNNNNKPELFGFRRTKRSYTLPAVNRGDPGIVNSVFQKQDHPHIVRNSYVQICMQPVTERPNEKDNTCCNGSPCSTGFSEV